MQTMADFFCVFMPFVFFLMYALTVLGERIQETSTDVWYLSIHIPFFIYVIPYTSNIVYPVLLLFMMSVGFFLFQSIRLHSYMDIPYKDRLAAFNDP